MASLLAADIGGTKSDLAVFEESAGGLKLLVQKRLRNSQFTGAEEVIEDFLSSCRHRPETACIAVAGVVAGDRVQLTNLPWVLDCRILEKRFAFRRVQLINDLTAVAAALPHLCPADLALVQAGTADGGEVRGIIAPGTGLGEGLLVKVDNRIFARGSEGGHCDFAPVDDEQAALLAFMRQKQRPVSYETLISGPGLAHLYQFAKSYHQLPETAAIAEAIARAADPIPVIVEGALAADGCPLCRRTVDLFLAILGSETGNLALKLYARGGMYLGGGILPRLIGKVSFAGFLQAFHAKGPMEALMRSIPVQVIKRSDAALFGAAHFGRDHLPGRAGDDPRG
ncbi:MAG: glucokinase [Desulforhopalus sp.]|nr:glucokinase [Desulforhopalus sp.]